MPSETGPAGLSIDQVANEDIRAFVDYWEDLKGSRMAPSWKEFDLTALPPHCIPNVVVADVIPGTPIDFIIRFWGTGHVARKGADKTGKSVKATPSFRGQTPYAEYIWVVEHKSPLASRDVVDFKDFDERLPFEQRLVRLPLSDDGVDVHQVISLASWDKI